MNPLYFDIHSHIQFPPFAGDKEALLSRMEEGRVGALVVGVDRKSSEDAIKEAGEKQWLYATAGLHPNDVFKEEFDEEWYRSCAKNKKIVAIGECGLDYFRTKPEADKIKKQKDILEKHISIAVEFGLPLMLHCRNAHEDLIDIFASKKKEHGEKLQGNIHFFTGSLDNAKKYLSLDFTLSFTGVLTFAREYDEVVEYLPLTHILSETDCPYATPVPYRGKRNEPVFVREIVKKIAEIRKESLEPVRDALASNARRVFLKNL